MGLMDQMKGMFGGEGNLDLGALQELLPEGGLQGLLDKLDAAGLGDKVQSWLGDGPNQPISGEELKSAVDAGKLEAAAGKLGVSTDEAANRFAGLLPDMVDKLAPGGNLPDPGSIMDKVKGLFS